MRMTKSDNEALPVVSLPLDSPLLFVSVAPQNSPLVADSEDDADREMEIVEAAGRKDEMLDVRLKGKECVPTPANASPVPVSLPLFGGRVTVE